MKLLANVIAVLATLVGMLWVLQGTNIVRGSFMSGQSLWLYIGIALVIGGAAALWWINLRS
ncbi:MAG: hypothetical protein IT535_09325 [Bauldia sp.]|nr:hypothetical protein [Bauldia sp.]